MKRDYIILIGFALLLVLLLRKTESVTSTVTYDPTMDLSMNAFEEWKAANSNAFNVGYDAWVYWMTHPGTGLGL